MINNVNHTTCPMQPFFGYYHSIFTTLAIKDEQLLFIYFHIYLHPGFK